MPAMSLIVVGWYLPVLLLVAREPLLRGLVVDGCLQASTATARAMATFLHHGGLHLFRLACERRRAARNTQEVDGFVVVAM